MDDWVAVNGAVIERKFFEENLAEAKGFVWTRSSPSNPVGRHAHCNICSIVVALDAEEFYESAGGILCSYCYTEFIALGKSLPSQ